VLGEQRRQRIDKQKREQEKSRRRAKREADGAVGARGATPVPNSSAAAGKPAPPAAAAAGPAARRGSVPPGVPAGPGGARVGAAARQRGPGSSRAAAGIPAAAVAAAAAGGGGSNDDLGDMCETDERLGESDTPAPRSQQGVNGRASTGVTSASIAAGPRAAAAGSDDMPPSPGDSSGSRWVVQVECMSSCCMLADGSAGC
jgi:hypothetical protein